MQIWENNLRARRRAAKLNAKRLRNNDNKREVSPENRYKKARELIARKYSTNEISKILKISERSVTRFKKRMREEKHKLIANGKLILDSNDEDTSYKYLNEQEKLKKAKSLFEKNLSFAQVAEICRVSERTARRWRNRLANFDSVPDNEDDDDPVPPTPTQSNDTKPKRQRRLYYDREKIKYAIELMENGLSNKEISMLLELSIANVRKLKVNILNGTVNDLIDDSEDHYSKVMVIDDPLDGVDGTQLPIAYSSRRKPKKNLTVREMHITRLLRERGLRTMDIAKMVGISERSVTRLISKSKEYHVHEYGIDVLEEVEKLLSCKEQILNGELVDLDKITVKLESAIPEIEINEDIINDELIKEDEMIIEDNKIDIVDEIVPEPDTATSFEQNFISKSRIGMDLIKMNVKVNFNLSI